MRDEFSLEDFSDVIFQQSAGLSAEDVHMDDLLREATERGASDLHLSVGLPPTIRIDGKLTSLSYNPLAPNDIQRLVYDILT
ncbi:MAG TPA: hypothetical protein PLZ21_12625, partial [Armatimonadota bacterium]|nr:hypothetical protein [Armatimonadota bacterium]